MARKASEQSSHGLNDVFGLALLAAALLLVVAQLSFDRHDLAANMVPPNQSTHNWIGPLGAHIANATFLVFGFAGYMLPVVLAFAGIIECEGDEHTLTGDSGRVHQTDLSVVGP